VTYAAKALHAYWVGLPLLIATPLRRLNT